MGEWSAPQQLGPGRTAPDTVVWALGEQGAMRRVEVRLRSSAAPRELAGGRVWWWTEEKSAAVLPAESGAPLVLCISQQPGRNRQCGYVTVDSAASASSRGGRRMTWVGKTFPQQRWSFVERTTR